MIDTLLNTVLEIKVCSAFRHQVLGYCKVSLSTLLYLENLDGYYDLSDVSGNTDKLGQLRIMVT